MQSNGPSGGSNLIPNPNPNLNPNTNPVPDRNFSQMVLAQSMPLGMPQQGSPLQHQPGNPPLGMDMSPLGGSLEAGRDQPLVLSRTAALAALGVDPQAWHQLSHVRRRVAVTGQVKKEICELKEQLGDVSQDEMVEQVRGWGWFRLLPMFGSISDPSVPHARSAAACLVWPLPPLHGC